MKLKKSIALCLMAFASATTAADNKLGYFSAPSIHDNSVVFTAEGDLWHTYTNVGTAKRLTTHESEETMASISPDGQSIAYIANYQGTFEAYTMPINGGQPKRLTFENARVRVQGWSHDGEVIYATTSGFGPANYWTLKTVNPNTLKTTELPLSDAIEGAVSSDGKYLFFTRFGLQVTGDNSRVYRGGAQGQIWRWALNSKQEATPLTKDHMASVREPMVYKDKVIFISDISGSDNLWSMDFDGNNKQQLTKHQDWEIRLASNQGNQVVYQLGADIHQFNLDNSTDKTLDISLVSDFAERQERWENKPMKYFNNAAIAGKAKKVVITARGKLAVAGLNNTRLVEIDTPAQSRTRSAVLSVDGKYVYAINDASGENEIWRFAADGSGQGKQLTKDGGSFRWNLYPSPNGNYLAHDDRDGNLWLLNLKTQKNQKIAENGGGFSAFDSVTWSADSKLIAFAGSHVDRQRSSIRLYSLAGDKEQFLTSDKYEAFSPTFSADGKWLYFISNRHFSSNPRSPWGDRNMGPAFDKRGQIFAYALTKDDKFPFSKPTELDKVNGSKNKDAKDDNKDSKKQSKSVSINWDGITDKLYQVPVANNNYSSLAASKKGLYVLESAGSAKNIKYIKFDNIEPKPETFAGGVLGYQLAANGEQILFAKRAKDVMETYIVDANAKAPKDLKKSKINSNHWQMAFSPADEWQQMFQDAWLMHREFLFDANMRGLDWAATKKKYQPLVDRITARSELNDIFAQMMGELNALHSQVRGGDVPVDKDSAKGSTLGARFGEVKNGVLIDDIYDGDKDLPAFAAPLAKAEVNAAEGDVITHINNKKVNSLVEMHQALRNQAKKQVLLTLERNGKTHKTVVVPTSARTDAALRYLDWVDHNRNKVASSNSDIGYLHMNAMTANDINSFAREFYANFDKDALIIDVRRNRGGNIDSWIIEKLLRQAWMFWQERNSAPYTNMQQTFRGHLVVLTDQLTYSDGETFSAGIKSLGLAPLIGKQTSGAGVWLTGRNRLTDNGMARVAELPQYSLQGEWVVEGTGVSPDIEVDNLPYATFMGSDAQLDAGIEYLLNKLKSEPIKPLSAKPMAKQGPAADINKIN
ncbi:PDZ domain-containing protein [Thalassotalea sp. HSM 43]|uniref:S41 family peptidase n=1 Tax=Thalassotalea sp. HSM 43 TaxID=2552945 RepID=UPI0010813CB4|nr:S41 family peptidase [Thalassotalea sp. HSM 43]QBY05101.1 PDZ domain-containing protein [Thalassotalea sp. HSM 43]